MQKLKQYWAIILLVIIILGGAFYWYELRPIPIRKKCGEYATNAAEKNNVLSDNSDAVIMFYKICIVLAGLND